MWAEAERLMREIEEVEREWRELEEAEMGQLTQEKEQLEEEKRVEQQRAAALHGSERVAEWRQAALPPEAGPSWAPPQKPEWTGGWGLLSLRRIACVASCRRSFVGGTQRGVHGVVNYVNNSKNCVGGSKSQWRRGSEGQRMRARVRGLVRGQVSGCCWSRWNGGGRRSGIPRWGLKSLRPYGLSMLAWVRSRPS